MAGVEKGGKGSLGVSAKRDRREWGQGTPATKATSFAFPPTDVLLIQLSQLSIQQPITRFFFTWKFRRRENTVPGIFIIDEL